MTESSATPLSGHQEEYEMANSLTSFFSYTCVLYSWESNLSSQLRKQAYIYWKFDEDRCFHKKTFWNDVSPDTVAQHTDK